MYSYCSFWYVLVSSFWAFLSFYTFFEFLLLGKDTFLSFLIFFLTTSCFHIILYLALGLVDMHSAVASM